MGWVSWRFLPADCGKFQTGGGVRGTVNVPDFTRSPAALAGGRSDAGKCYGW